jgi:gamma-butyrobetaine dioxygenase
VHAELSVQEVDGRPVVKATGADGTIALPALWLRERTQAPDQLDLVTGQRLFDPHRLPADLELVEARLDGGALVVAFSDGHREALGVEVLLGCLTPADGCPPPRPWRSDLVRPPLHDWSALDADAGLRAALHDLIAYGVVVIDGAPTAPGTVLEVAGRLGYVRDTNFGRLFDVRTVPGSNDLAYRAVALGPHTDNPYREPVPGIQLLHCLVNETTGGQSTLVDALAVTEQLAVDDPEALWLLRTVPVTFRFRDADTELVTQRAVVAVDDTGAITGLHYSPRLDHLPLLPEAELVAYQRARRRLAELVVDPAFELRFVLAPGQVLVFANDRVLHGRTGFDPQEGSRHLQGCYIDHDAPRSRYRVLIRERAGTRAGSEV